MNTNHIMLVATFMLASCITCLNAQQQPAQHNLLTAIRAGNEADVKESLNKGAKVNQAGDLGRTPLHEAALQSKDKIVALLIQQGASVNQTDNEQGTPLFWAAWAATLPRANTTNVVNTIKILLANKANPNVVTVDGETALHQAAKSGNKEIVSLLLKNGATPSLNVKEKTFKKTPRDIAQDHKYNDVIAAIDDVTKTPIPSPTPTKPASIATQPKK